MSTSQIHLSDDQKNFVRRYLNKKNGIMSERKHFGKQKRAVQLKMALKAYEKHKLAVDQAKKSNLSPSTKANETAVGRPTEGNVAHNDKSTCDLHGQHKMTSRDQSILATCPNSLNGASRLTDTLPPSRIGFLPSVERSSINQYQKDVNDLVSKMVTVENWSAPISDIEKIQSAVKEQFYKFGRLSYKINQLGKPATENSSLHKDLELLVTKCENSFLKQMDDIKQFSTFHDLAQGEIEWFECKRSHEIERALGLMKKKDVLVLESYLKTLTEELDHHTKVVEKLSKMAQDLEKHPAKVEVKRLENKAILAKQNLVYYRRCTMVHYNDLKSSLLTCRANDISRPITGKVIDHFRNSEINLDKDEQVTIINTADQRRWVVRKADGTEASLPSILFRILRPSRRRAGSPSTSNAAVIPAKRARS